MHDDYRNQLLRKMDSNLIARIELMQKLPLKVGDPSLPPPADLEYLLAENIMRQRAGQYELTDLGVGILDAVEKKK